MTHSVYSRDATVHLVTGANKLEALHRAIDQSGFIANLNQRWSDSGKPRQAFRIAIKPNIMTASIHEPDSPVYTDPALVEELVRVMQAQGFTEFDIVEAENVYNYSYRGRRVAEVARMCGYSADGYRISSATEDHVPFDYGGLLGRHVVGRAWLDADYRVSFAKNKTHWQCFYTACLKNIYGCLPEWDKMRHYHTQRRGRNIEFSDATILICDRLSIHFGFLDAWVSGDGLTGHVRDAHPNATRTIFASDNIFALDWVAGEKMQIDPLDNAVVRRAVEEWGAIDITRNGDMTPWHPWDNVRPWVVRALDAMEELYWLSRFMSRTMAAQQDPRFKPVSRAQWFFNITHTIVRWADDLMVKPAPAVSGARTFEMGQRAMRAVGRG